MRYVVPLKRLDEALHFINPKDAGTKYGDQNLKGNGKDIILLNSLTGEQVKGLDEYMENFSKNKKKSPDEMTKAEVKEFLSFLEKNGYNDRYCSDQDYMASSLVPSKKGIKIGLFSRNKDDICKVVIVPKGATYSDGVKTQEANIDGALFMVDSKGGARITNVPEDYQTKVPGSKITSYADAMKAVQSTLLQGR